MSLPPIQYIENEADLVPGEVGVRLLHTVTVRDPEKVSNRQTVRDRQTDTDRQP